MRKGSPHLLNMTAVGADRFVQLVTRDSECLLPIRVSEAILGWIFRLRFERNIHNDKQRGERGDCGVCPYAESSLAASTVYSPRRAEAGHVGDVKVASVCQGGSTNQGLQSRLLSKLSPRFGSSLDAELVIDGVHDPLPGA